MFILIHAYVQATAQSGVTSNPQQGWLICLCVASMWYTHKCVSFVREAV